MKWKSPESGLRDVVLINRELVSRPQQIGAPRKCVDVDEKEKGSEDEP